MTTHVIKLDVPGRGPRFMLWSTIVDAPMSLLLPDARFRFVLSIRAPSVSWKVHDDRIRRAQQTGTSAQHESLDRMLTANSAGLNDCHLSIAEIIEQYSLPQAVEDGRVSL